MIVFQSETLQECRCGDFDSLLMKNYEELTFSKDIVKLDPDWDRYQSLHDAGKLQIYTLRDSGILLGYAYFFVDTHIHYKDLLVANNDVIFIDASVRKGVTGIKFLKFCESSLKSLHVNKIIWHVKGIRDFGPILCRMGYTVEDTLYGKIV